MKTNRILAIAAAALFLLSFLTYNESVKRAERFERGQKFLPHLNPDTIAEIVVTKGGETTRLERAEDHFVVASAGDYPAKNEAINRFVRDVLDLSLDKEVGRGEELFAELALTPEGEGSTEVVFRDAADKEMVHFLIGKEFEGGGNYVRRTDTEDDAAYLTSSRIALTTTDDDFLDKEILNVGPSEVTTVRGPDYVIEKQEDGTMGLAEAPEGGEANASKISQATGMLSYLRFTAHHLANASEIQGLAFGPPVEIVLEDGSGYQLAVASRDEKHYLRLQGFHTTEQVSVAMDAEEEEVKETSELLARLDEIRSFNSLHGSWIYEIDESTAEKIGLHKADLLADS